MRQLLIALLLLAGCIELPASIEECVQGIPIPTAPDNQILWLCSETQPWHEGDGPAWHPDAKQTGTCRWECPHCGTTWGR